MHFKSIKNSFLGFYATGVMTVIWFVFWVILVHETPRKHPRITQEEIQYIESNIVAKEKPRQFPW